MIKMTNNMKSAFFCLSIVSLLSLSCKDEESVPIADFNLIVVGKAPDARVIIENNSIAATSFIWTFGKNSNLDTTDLKHPPVLTVYKAGNFDVTLELTNGSNKTTLSKTVEIK